ncbi:MAG TPA: hypothetical protein VLA64_01920 [Azonexus sp.]|nr:hypothetical protein [Azonexus sp.]
MDIKHGIPSVFLRIQSVEISSQCEYLDLLNATNGIRGLAATWTNTTKVGLPILPHFQR